MRSGSSSRSPGRARRGSLPAAWRRGPRAGNRMKGRTAVVTGGSRGIGRAIVLELARRGARVRVAWAEAETAAAGVEEEARRAGGEAAGARVDVRDRDLVRDWIQE